MADSEASSAVIEAFRALMGQDSDVALGFLHAAVYARAIHTEDSPRNVLEGLWKSLPGSDGWPALREALLGLEDDGSGEAGTAV